MSYCLPSNAMIVDSTSKIAVLDSNIILYPDGCFDDFGFCVSYSRLKVFPNPASNILNIEYHIPISAKVNIYLYNINGQEIINMVNKYQEKGRYKIEVDVHDYASGSYLLFLIASDYMKAIKLNIVK
ncbi:MAG: T9SS type A sorting domain-containing protein [bacterium]